MSTDSETLPLPALSADSALVTAVRSGDLAAADVLLSRHQDGVYTVVLRLLADEAEAEDIAQEALLRGYTRIAELEDPERFGAWLRRIAINLSLTRLRRRGLLKYESLDAAGPDHRDKVLRQPYDRGGNPDEAVLLDELRSELERAIAQLPPDQRIAVVLRDMYDYDVAEIAKLQGCGLSAAKMRIARARASLRKSLIDVTLQKVE